MAEHTQPNLEKNPKVLRREEELAALERAVENYYSSLSDAEVAEHARWTEFAEREFPGDDQSSEWA